MVFTNVINPRAHVSRKHEFQNTLVREGATLGAIPVEVKNGTDPVRFLWLQGKPIEEPVAKYGPFVMNQAEEINQAIEEYRLTQFGGWPWPYPDNVHPRSKARFAHYPNGHLEDKG